MLTQTLPTLASSPLLFPALLVLGFFIHFSKSFSSFVELTTTVTAYADPSLFFSPATVRMQTSRRNGRR